MADEFETTTRETRVVPETTVVHEVRSGGGSGAGWVIALLLVLALIAGFWFFSQSNTSEARKDNAIANAAQNVGAAAEDVGQAAKDAANKVQP